MSNDNLIKHLKIENDEKVYMLTQKQLDDIINKKLQVVIAEEQKRKAQEQLDKVRQQNNYVFVEVKNKNIIQKIAKSICEIIEWKWSIEKNNNIRKKNIAEFHRQMDIETARKKGIID